MELGRKGQFRGVSIAERKLIAHQQGVFIAVRFGSIFRSSFSHSIGLVLGRPLPFLSFRFRVRPQQ